MVVNHFYLRLPNSRSVLPLGVHMRARESMLTRAAYLSGAWKTQFFKDGNSNLPTLPLPAHAWYSISVVSAT